MPFQHNKINVKLRCHNLLPEPRCRSPETLALLGPHVRLGPPRLQSIGGVEQPRDAAHVALAPLDDAAVRVVAGHEGAHPWVEGDDALWYTCKEEQKKKRHRNQKKNIILHTAGVAQRSGHRLWLQRTRDGQEVVAQLVADEPRLVVLRVDGNGLG